MPLLDHFNAPLYPLHQWESFHTRWANAIADLLDRSLPPRFFAEVQTHLGTQVEADVAEFEGPADSERELSPNGASGGLAIRAYAPPEVTMTLPVSYPDDFEVQVRDKSEDARLVAVVELVSPRNKDRPAARKAFAAKCMAYLQRGIGVVTVDIVTTRQGNMHNEFVKAMGLEDKFEMPAGSSLVASAYRPARRNESNEIDVWNVNLTIGDILPVLPLALLRHGVIPLDLEASYEEARQRARL